MKKRILLWVLILTLVGCSTTYRMEGVQAEFPDSEISFVPTHDHDFLVRKPDGSVWYVRCDNPVTNGVTSKAMIFKGNK